jgi:cephalosporin hydroxylase
VSSLYELFLSRQLNLHKWHNYFWVYQRHFEQFVGKEICFLEIGVQRGGSTLLFKEWFGKNAKIVGIDIDPNCREIDFPPGIEIEIGDQSDPNFLKEVVRKHGPFDVVLDDGGHTFNQITSSFKFLFEHLKEDSVYMIEDVCCQFWEGSEFVPEESAGNFKDFIWSLYEEMNKDMAQRSLMSHWRIPLRERDKKLHDTSSGRFLKSLALYESIAVIEKSERPIPFCELRK